MVLSDLSIRRPVLATVMSVLLVLVGVIAYQRLTVREYPNIDEPVVTVETRYPGASAQIMETQVTQPLEESLAGIEGINIITSINRAEASQITVTFRLDRDADAAASDVRDRVGRVRDRLPDEIDEPVIAKVEADAQPIIYMAFSSDRHSALQMTDVADRYVKDRLQSIPGISEVRIFGERRYSMRIWIDPEKLAAYNLTVQDIEDALRSQNVEIPAGRIESVEREFTVLSQTNLTSRSGFERIIIKNVNGYPVRLRDVAVADISSQDDRVTFRVDGREAVALGVIKQSTANPLEISQAIEDALPEIQSVLPEGMKVEKAYDTSIFIERSIDNVLWTIGEATSLVLLIIFVFLRSLRATLVPLVTIPVSLIASFALMMLFGFSINTLTLLALVLAVGLVVDDAIVMLENISRHVEEGMTPMKAALVGSKEIGFAIVAMTLTLTAVYVPVAFQTGRTGQLFTEFALTLAGAVLVSGFVALSLSPMMSSRLLRHQKSHGWVYRVTEAGMNAMTRGYRAAVAGSLKVWPLVLLVYAGVIGAGYVFYASLNSELSPLEDRGVIIGVAMAPEGATLEYTDKYVRKLEAAYAQIPEHRSYGVVIGFPVVNQSFSFLVLKDWEQRERKSMEIAGSLFPAFFGLPGVLAFPINPPSLGQSGFEQPVSFVVQGSMSYEELDRVVGEIVAEARKNPGLINLDTDLKLNKPELKITVDRDKLSDLGINVDEVGRTLETLLGGRQVTRFNYSGEQYDVIVKLTEEMRRRPEDIANIYVRSASGAMVPLSNIVTIQESVAPRELNHFNKLRAVTISATLAPGYSLGEALEYLEETTQRIAPGVLYDYSGQSREFRESSAGLYVTFVLALFFIYLVLAAQFESFIDPLIILFTVPLSMAGALLGLNLLQDGSLNVYSQIGLVTLIGLISKHGILIVEFANQIRARGKSKREAVIEAATLRLRPILMTTGAMVLGALPLARAVGAGAEARHQIGWVIVGGISIGTLFTLFVVPTVYVLLARRTPRAAAIEAAGAAAPQPAE